MKVQTVDDVGKGKWDDFVLWRSKNGTLMHTRRFLDYHNTDRFFDKSTAYIQDGYLVALFPANVEDGKLYSHQGSSYGGFVVSRDFTVEDGQDVMDAFLDVYSGVDIEEIRFAPYIVSQAPADTMKFLLHQNGFSVKYKELGTCYHKDFYFDYPTHSAKRMDQNKGIDFVSECDISGQFYQILVDVLERHNAKPTHSLFELKNLQDRFPESIYLNSAVWQGECVGGTVVFEMNDSVSHIFYSANRRDIEGLQIGDFIVDQTIKHAFKNGKTWVNYGISTEKQGEEVNEGLFAFKEKFGGYNVMREVWTNG